MNDRLLLKAKRKFDGKWFKGTGILEDGVNTWLISNEVGKAIGYGMTNIIIDPDTISRCTGYEMFEVKVFIGDLVSNNYGTDKEAIREVVEREGQLMLKRVKGTSRLPKFVLMHDFYNLNFKIIGNIHKENK